MRFIATEIKFIDDAVKSDITAWDRTGQALMRRREAGGWGGIVSPALLEPNRADSCGEVSQVGIKSTRIECDAALL